MPRTAVAACVRERAVPGPGMNRLQARWLALRTSLWFVPALMVLVAVGLALLLVGLEPTMQRDLADRWPRLFGAGAEGSRGVLTAIATSMATVAGVVFSVTIVALAQASSQYSPRVLRNFMSDRPTQVTLGAFVAVFAYCLVVLRTIRADDGFVPSIAVLGGVVMAFIGLGLLIFFIHHLATEIQASSIIERIADDTREAIDRLFPSEVGDEASPDDDAAGEVPPSGPGRVRADRSGYVLAIEAQRLLEVAARHDLVIRVLPRVGDFVSEDQPLLAFDTAALPRGLDPASLRECVSLGPERDVHQDAPHGLQQLVDVGLRALSPSLHDPTTALACIDRLGALLLRLTGRRIESPFRERDSRLRLIAVGPRYDELVEIALGELTHHAGAHAAVHRRLAGVVGQVLEATHDPGRCAALQRRVAAHRARLPTAGLAAEVQAEIDARLQRLERG
jgi:uncharacterized membrane protein